MGHLPEGLIEFQIVYGLGSSFRARFDLEKIEGWSVRQIIQDAIDRPRLPGPEDRTAKVLADILREGREVDVELVDGPSDGGAIGRPITLQHVVIPVGDTSSRTTRGDTMTIQVSESYRGGSSWMFSTRC